MEPENYNTPMTFVGFHNNDSRMYSPKIGYGPTINLPAPPSATTLCNHNRRRSCKNMDQLDDNLLRHVFSFIPGNYRYVGGVNRRFRTVYQAEHRSMATSLKNAVASIWTT